MNSRVVFWKIVHGFYQNLKPTTELCNLSIILGGFLDSWKIAKLKYLFMKGIKTNHSTNPCLTSLYDKILKVFDNAWMSDMIPTNLQKAFDTIDHDIHLKKLSAIGFSNHRIGWFKSYLSIQLFKVNLESCYSNPSNTTCGMP